MRSAKPRGFEPPPPRAQEGGVSPVEPWMAITGERRRFKTMWLRLGEGEIINLDFVVSIKKGDYNSVEFNLDGGGQRRVMFDTPHDRDQAFEAFKNNLVKLRLAME